MFFISEFLIDTLVMTIKDAMYSHKGTIPREPRVLIHHSTYNWLLLQTKRKLPYGMLINIDLTVPMRWQLDNHFIDFFRSRDIPEDKIYLFFEDQITTITIQKPNNEPDKSTLP